MSIESLSSTEQLALSALMRRLVLADARVSSPEVAKLNRLVAQVGAQILGDAERLIQDDPAGLDPLLDMVTRPEARRVIYDALVEAAECDGLVEVEATMLTHVRAAWALHD